MDIKTAIERLESLKRRRKQLSDFLEHAHRDDIYHGKAAFIISGHGGHQKEEITLGASITDVIIPKVEDELLAVSCEIEKITPVIDAANMQLKGIFS